FCVVFFFQAEDGIRDGHVTGVQTCALPICSGFSEAPTSTAMRVEVLDPEYSAEMQGRLSKLEAAISKQRTVKFPYWSISRDDERSEERRVGKECRYRV